MSGYTRLRALTRALIAPLAAALALAATAAATPPTPPVVNGSFELGNLSGWTSAIPAGGTIDILPGGAPGGGGFFARLKTDGPGSYTTLSQTVSASQGDLIKGSSRFNDAEGSCFYNDSTQVHIKSGATIIATPFATDSCAPGFGTGPWVEWSFIVPADGVYTVEARIANAVDSIVDSTVDLDNVRVVKALRNGSFEDGNLGGWLSFVPVGGLNSVVAGGAPGAGAFHARLKTDGPGSYATLSQAVTLAAGETISGSARFNNAEGNTCFFNDNAQVQILDAAGTTVLATPYAEDSCGTPFGPTPWTSFSFTAPSDAVYIIRGRIANAVDSIVDSTLDLDGVKVGAADTTPPVLTVPANITTEATSPAGAVVTYTATATDNADPAPTVSCSPASGGTFALGTTTVSCTATDASGNSSTGSFLVSVVDTTPPALTVPADMTLEATGPSGAVATYTATATDIVDTSPSVSCSPASGSTFAIGTTAVTCTATDDAGNSVSDSFDVLVQDTTAPVVTCVNGVNPAGKTANESAGFRTASATDAVGVVSLTFSSGAFSWTHAGSTANVKLTQAPGSTGESAPGEGQVLALLKGPLDFTVTAGDAAGNTATVSCGDLPPLGT